MKKTHRFLLGILAVSIGGLLACQDALNRVEEFVRSNNIEFDDVYQGSYSSAGKTTEWDMKIDGSP